MRVRLRSLKKGDRVILPEFGGAQLKVEEDEYFIYREAEILAVIKE